METINILLAASVSANVVVGLAYWKAHKMKVMLEKVVVSIIMREMAGEGAALDKAMEEVKDNGSN